MLRRAKPYRSSLYDNTTNKRNKHKRLAVQTAAQDNKGWGRVLHERFPRFHAPSLTVKHQTTPGLCAWLPEQLHYLPQTPDHSPLWVGQPKPSEPLDSSSAACASSPSKPSMSSTSSRPFCVLRTHGGFGRCVKYRECAHVWIMQICPCCSPTPAVMCGIGWSQCLGRSLLVGYPCFVFKSKGLNPWIGNRAQNPPTHTYVVLCSGPRLSN